MIDAHTFEEIEVKTLMNGVWPYNLFAEYICSIKIILKIKTNYSRKMAFHDDDCAHTQTSNARP
jgi:hypothetical protein